jgi:hypothetical protein
MDSYVQVPAIRVRPVWQPVHDCDDKQLVQPMGHDAQEPLPGKVAGRHDPEKPARFAYERESTTSMKTDERHVDKK